VNISLRPEFSIFNFQFSNKKPKLGTKVEIKNINSIKFAADAIDYEIKRQIAALGEGEKLIQETRGWDENKSITVRQRIKETSADYRYFPEPDIPPLKIDEKWLKKIKSHLSEMPSEKKKRFIDEYNFNDSDAEILISDRNLADYTEKVISELRGWIKSTGDSWQRQRHKLAKISANWLIHELFKHMKEDNITIKDVYPVKSSEAGAKQFNRVKITPENFAELVTLVYQGKINSSAAQKILAAMYKKGGDPTNIMADMGLEQIDDHAALEKIIKEVLDKNKEQADEYRAGKEKVFQFLVGQTMSATKGKANPKIVQEILKKLLISKK
jgi:aspartyl-tRNA(Asn)/glutamyl-tRNA(Gln) amidotransferase subunit B